MKWRWVHLAAGARRPTGSAGHDLMRRLNNVGRELQRPVIITSGRRTNLEQHRAYMDYLEGGTLAAPCCSKHYRHAWAECLRQCASNHCVGRAADCVLEAPGGGYVNIGEDQAARRSLRSHGLCLPVGSGETWHVEVGSVWRS